MDGYDAIELAAKIFDFGEDVDEDVVTERIWSEFDVEVETFRKIASALIDFTPAQKSPLTGSSFVGFVDNKAGCFIVKKQIDR